MYITNPCRSCQNIAFILTNSEKRDRIFIMDYFIESKGKEMKLKEKSKYYVFPHITMSLWWIFFSFIVFITGVVLLDRQSGSIPRAVILAFTVGYPIIYIVLILIFHVFYWNAVVRFDAEGMHQRRGKRIISWKWEEIIEVNCRTDRPWPLRTSAGAIYAPKFVFISSKHNKKLSIVMEKYAREVFFKMCKNEAIKEKSCALLNKCNFSFL